MHLLSGVMLVMAPIAAHAHAGEDHGEAKAPPPAAVAGMQGNVLTSSATTDYFEVVAKYPVTEAGEETRMRLFVADYTTNSPVASAELSLAFRPAGVRVIKAPAMISPGIYDLVVSFPDDTIYSFVATVTAAKRTDFVEVRNLYAGDAAERFLAEHGGAASTTEKESESSWMLPAAIIAAALASIIAIVAFARRRRSTAATDAGVARDPELATQPDPLQPQTPTNPES
jgi:hypothetical protein